MKKILLIILPLIICGCSSTNQTEKNNVYKDGTYTTTAHGYGGDFKVETILKDDKIIDIVVKEHNETPSIGGVAVEQIISKMKEKNTYDVDVISGATRTSQGIKGAVEEAMKNAKNTTK